MKITWCLVVCFVASFNLADAALLSPLPSSNDVQWESFKGLHGKNYANFSEDSMRQEIFLENKRRIDRFNARQNGSYKKGLNKFSDWTREELSKLNGFRSRRSNEQHYANNRLDSKHPMYKFYMDPSVPLPDFVDWRQVPARVGPVAYQANCGSCWAFAAAGVLEGQELARGRKNLTTLSVQYLVDCSESNFGCNGGEISWALNDVKLHHGIAAESDYPYVAEQAHTKQCPAVLDPKRAVISDSGFLVLQRDEELIKSVLAKFGPVAAAIDALNLFHYKSGVLRDPTCDKNWSNHAVLLVGYGTDNESKLDYWIIKNSWGADWGEQGYFRIVMHENMCGIAREATIPTF